MRRSPSPLVLTTAGLLLAACGPSTMPDQPDQPECGTEDIQTEAELVIGVDGPSCDPCPADAELGIVTTLSTECGPVEWELPSTCLVYMVEAVGVTDGQTYTLNMRWCGSAFTDWSVVPGEPLVVQEIAASEVFGVSPIPTGTYAFEVMFPPHLSIETPTFEVTIE